MSETLSFIGRSSDKYRSSSSMSVVKQRQAWQGAFNPVGMKRFLINIYPVKTAENVAADTGIASRTVQRWLSEEPIAPNMPSLLCLACVYGAPFLAESLTRCPQWLNDYVRLTRLSEIQSEIERVEAELTIWLNAGRGDED